MIKNLLTVLTVLMFFSFNVSAQENTGENSVVVNYCDVIKTPEIYKDKLINVRGLYAFGFEYSGLRGDVCLNDQNNTWVKWLEQRSCGDQNIDQILKTFHESLEPGPLDGVFRGTFRVAERNGFGHLNGNKYQLEITCVQSATLLPEDLRGCKRVDKTLPFHYLEFEKIETGIMPDYGTGNFAKNKQKLVWLKLANNSACPISISVDPTFKTEYLSGAKTPVIYSLSLHDRGRFFTDISITPDRLITKNKRQRLMALPAGNFVFFAVPLKYFREGYNIVMKYGFADIASANHDLYFSGDKIRKEYFKK